MVFIGCHRVRRRLRRHVGRAWPGAERRRCRGAGRRGRDGVRRQRLDGPHVRPARLARPRCRWRRSNLDLGPVAPDVDVNDRCVLHRAPAACVRQDANGLTPCIRVDVYRNQARGNPLPAIFGLRRRAGQPRRARDRDRACGRGQRERLHEAVGDSRQMDRQRTTHPQDNTWTLDDTFETGVKQGNNWTPYDPPDVYIPPSATAPAPASRSPPISARGDAQGRRSADVDFAGCVLSGQASDLRRRSTLAATTIATAFRHCNGLAIPIGTDAPERERKHDRPHGAGRRRPDRAGSRRRLGSRRRSRSSTVARRRTPRAAPAARASSRFRSSTWRCTKARSVRGFPQFKIVNILGFFLDQMQGNDVRGFLTEAPGLTVGADATIDPRASFLSQIQLIR